MQTIDSRRRFSNRAEDYKQYRPGYPDALVQFILDNCPLDTTSSIVDIGSGTGLSARLLLSGISCQVYGVEPNEAMRLVAESAFRGEPRFISVAASAESTTLDNDSISLITTFQSFHWFNNDLAAMEFQRILKSPGFILFVWNDRLVEGTPFLKGYEALLQELPDYQVTNHKNISPDQLLNFSGCKKYISAVYPNVQILDLQGVKGRFFSSSYTPAPDSLLYGVYCRKLDDLFSQCAIDGQVTFKYDTKAFLVHAK